MITNKNPSKTKVESRISTALKQYARSQLESNNPRLNTTSDSKNIYTVPKLQTPKNPDQKKIFSRYNNYRQNIPSLSNEPTRNTKYKQNTERNTGHRSINKNHSFFESKNNKTETKKYPQRSSNTYKQPESRNLQNNYRERKQTDISNISNSNNTNNIKRKYETTSYEHPGRRKKNYENKSYQGEKYPPKYYRNNPHIYNINNNPLLNSNTLVAQKICNIAIKGGSSNIEKESISLSSNNNRRGYPPRMIEYEVEENNLRYNYNNEEEIEEDSMNNYNEENNGEKKSKILKKKIKRKKAPKRKNYNPIIEMQKAQSFEQPRDYNFMPKQKNTKPKFVIGVEDSNNNYTNKKQEKPKNEYLKTDDNNYKINNQHKELK